MQRSIPYMQLRGGSSSGNGSHGRAILSAPILHPAHRYRANHARRSGGDATIKQAEAFQRILPQVIKEL